jgi:hypothetical protein
MVENFRGVSRVLGAGDSFALDVVVRCPDLLGNRPVMVQERLHRMGQLLQVSDSAAAAFVVLHLLLLV